MMKIAVVVDNVMMVMASRPEGGEPNGMTIIQIMQPPPPMMKMSNEPQANEILL